MTSLMFLEETNGQSKPSLAVIIVKEGAKIEQALLRFLSWKRGDISVSRRMLRFGSAPSIVTDPDALITR